MKKSGLMTTYKLVALRIVMTTLGRWGWFAERFKRLMVYYTINRQGEEKYVASSRFFTLDQLERDS